MDRKICSNKEHQNIEGKTFCQECNTYMCIKCENYHSKLCENHHIFKIKENIDIFTGFCKIENHSNKLFFFCKTHNQLCCAACLSVINDNKYGQHKNCEVYNLENIKDEKQNKLKHNIKLLQEISDGLQGTIKKLEILYDKMDSDKEKLKIQIIRIFTEIRNQINKREDEILSEIDDKFKNIFFNEKIVQESKKLPNKIKKSLDKGQEINNLWHDNAQLSHIINDCIKIEENLKDVNNIYEKMKRCLSLTIDIKFDPDISKISENFLFEMINCFGQFEYKEIINDNIDKAFDDYLQEKLKQGIRNICAASLYIETNLDTENPHLKTLKKKYEKSFKKKLRKGIDNILAFSIGANIPIKDINSPIKSD